MQLGGELARRGEVVAEGLLDDHARGGGKRAGVGEAGDDGCEQRRRDLEVEDRRASRADRLCDAFEGRRIGEVAADVGEPLGQAREDLRVDVLAARGDRVVGVLAQPLDRPVVDRDADDRAVQQPARLEAVERAQRHLLGEISR